MLFKDEKIAEQEHKTMQLSNDLGLEARYLSSAETQEMEHIDVDVLGGIYYPKDAHIDPSLFMKQLRAALEKDGVHFLEQSKVIDFFYGRWKGYRLSAIG